LDAAAGTSPDPCCATHPWPIREAGRSVRRRERAGFASRAGLLTPARIEKSASWLCSQIVVAFRQHGECRALGHESRPSSLNRSAGIVRSRSALIVALHWRSIFPALATELQNLLNARRRG